MGDQVPSSSKKQADKTAKKKPRDKAVDLLGGIFATMDADGGKFKNNKPAAPRPKTTRAEVKTENQAPDVKPQTLTAPTSSSSTRYRIPKRTAGQERTAPPQISDVTNKRPRAEDSSAIKLGAEVPVKMNLWQFDISKGPEFVDQIHVQIFVKKESGKELPCTDKNMKNDIWDQKRRKANFAFLRQLVQEAGVFLDPQAETNEQKKKNQYNYVYDGFCVLYGLPGLFQGAMDEVLELEFQSDELLQFHRSIFAHKLISISVNLKKTRKVSIKGFDSTANPEILVEAARFFEILSSQYIFDGRYFLYGTRFYRASNDNDLDLGDQLPGRVVKLGYERSVRFIDNDNQATPILVVDVKCAPFYKKLSVMEFLAELLKCRPEYTFEQEDREVTAFQYYQEKYFRTLAHPNLPLLIQRTARYLNLYPLEFLEVEAGQKMKQNKINASVQDIVTTMSQMLPEELTEVLDGALVDMNIGQKGNRYFRAFNISLNTQRMTVKAKMIPGPQVVFKNTTVEMKEGNIHVPSFAGFYRAATVKTIAFATFGVPLPEDFISKFFNGARKMGIKILQREDQCKYFRLMPDNPELLKETMEKIKGKVDILFAISDGTCRGVHEYLKLFEATVGVQTQHIAYKHAVKLSFAIERDVLFKNIMRKFNLKTGGLNFTLKVPQKLCENISKSEELQNKLFKNTMIVALDLSHAAAQQKWDRQAKAPIQEPSFVGVSFSLREPTELGGYFWPQKPREHEILDLGSHLLQAVRRNANLNGRLPEKIVIYRSGVGETGVIMVQREARNVRDALRLNEELKKMNNGRPYEPAFVVLLVQKHSNYRMVPVEIRGRKANEQNVKSGTYIDHTILTSGYDDFILVSQKSMMGTCRPTRYTVVQNDVRWHKDEIVFLTYALAYGHQVNFGGVASVTDTLFGAENMAKRARSNFMGLRQFELPYDELNSTEMPQDSRSGNVFDELANKLSALSMNHMFWA
ncbi:unnamed protein product [Caenorhabditis auriculariae]|uniref:Piwi domain-containing protein n=1 Tax=Caenorhabditis auriculariae TaxID=2777116 RepID=A0A8S1HGG8_9PELO|nr:unnamed protein product [Caenorhabditis auriculariae]